jgi:hypothetical protein
MMFERKSMDCIQISGSMNIINPKIYRMILLNPMQLWLYMQKKWNKTLVAAQINGGSDLSSIGNLLLR